MNNKRTGTIGLKYTQIPVIGIDSNVATRTKPLINSIRVQSLAMVFLPEMEYEHLANLNIIPLLCNNEARRSLIPIVRLEEGPFNLALTPHSPHPTGAIS